MSIHEALHRAWDWRNKSMIEDVIVSSSMLLFPVTEMRGELFGIDGIEYVQVSKEAYPIMNNSYIKDSCDTSIFSGDVLSNVADSSVKGIVVYNRKKACYTINLGDGEIPLYEAVATHTLEVIGDMYTNEKELGSWGLAQPLPF